MRCVWSWGLMVVAVALWSAPAAAQERPLEVSFGLDGIASSQGNGGDLRLTFGIPAGDRLTFELFGGPYRGNDTLRTEGVYGFQIRQRLLRHRPGIEPFFTYGALGVIARSESFYCSPSPCRWERRTQVLPPLLGLLGVGVEYPVASRLKVRVELQGGFFLILPVGVRAAAAFTIPLGANGTSAGAARRSREEPR